MDTPNWKNLEFVLWGPSGSGKTFLLRAFQQRIRRLNEILCQDDFELLLEQEDEISFQNDGDSAIQPAVVGPGQQIEGTRDPQLESYRFTRRRVNDKDKLFAYEVSSHTHTITLIDNPGGDLPGFVGINISPSEEDKPKISYARDKIENAICVFIVLHCGHNTPSEYMQAFDQLYKIILSHDIGKRYIVACVTQADRLGEGLDLDRNTDALMNAALGQELADTIRQRLKDLNAGRTEDDRHELFYTSCSSVGYVYDDATGKRIPNVQDNKLLEIDNRWNPVRVEEGFFWLLENMERERLAQSDDQKGLFYSLFGDVAASRVNDYISYEALVNHYHFLKRTHKESNPSEK